MAQPGIILLDLNMPETDAAKPSGHQG